MNIEEIKEIKEILAYVLSLTYGNDNALKGVNQIQDYITNLEQEIDRLNNIINELEKYMIKEQARIVINNTDEDEFIYTDLLIKLKELKDSD